MGTRDTHNAARKLNEASPFVVRIGDKQWVVGSGHQDVLNPPEARDAGDEMTTGGPEDATRRPFVSKRQAFTHTWGHRIIQSIDHLLEPHEGVEGATTTGPHGRSKQGARIRRGRRTYKDTFQFGCILGLVLGCLSLVLFHQMETGPVSTPLSGVGEPVITSGSSIAFAVPSIKVNLVQAGVFPTADNATKAADKLYTKRFPGVLHHDDKGYSIWVGAAVQSSHAKRTAQDVSKQGVQADAKAVYLPVRQVPAISGASSASMKQVSRWFSSAVSSLTALTAVLSDGGVTQDAVTSMQSTQRLYPNEQALAETGKSDQLQVFEANLQGAFDALNHHQQTPAQKYILSDYELLYQLHH